MANRYIKHKRTKLEGHFAEVFKDVVNSRMTQTQIAAKYGVSQQSVSEFVARNQEAIDQAMNSVVDYNKHIAVSDKGYRISELGSLYDTAKAELQTAESHSDKALMLNQARGALKQVAEELGQLPRPDQNINVRAQLLIREIGGTEVDVS